MGVHMQRIENQIETYNSWDTGKFKKRGGGVEGISFILLTKSYLSLRKVRDCTSLLSIINWQLGQALLGLLFHVTLSGWHVADALFIFVAILLLSTNHDGLHKLHKLLIIRIKAYF